jgi:hypothetical protein
MTAQELAARCAALGARNLTAAVIANIETGRRNGSGERRRDVTIDELAAIALALDIQPIDLLGPHEGWSALQVTPDVQATPADIAGWMKGEHASVVPSLLGGLALCGACQRELLARRDTNDDIVYFCANSDCPEPRINRLAKFIDEYVSGFALGGLQHPESFTEIFPEVSEGLDYINAEIASMDGQIEGLKRRRVKVQQELENLADHPSLSPEILARSLASFNQKIKELERSRRQVRQQAVLSRNLGMLKDAWDELSLVNRREIVESLASVTLVPLPKGEHAKERASGLVLHREDLRVTLPKTAHQKSSGE